MEPCRAPNKGCACMEPGGAPNKGRARKELGGAPNNGHARMEPCVAPNKGCVCIGLASGDVTAERDAWKRIVTGKTGSKQR